MELKDYIISLAQKGEVIAANIYEQVAAQAPDLVEQLLSYTFAISMIWFSVGIFCTIIIPLIVFGFCLSIYKETDDFEVFGFLIPAAFPAFFGMFIIAENMEWLKIWLAPKLFLLEYITNLIK